MLEKAFYTDYDNFAWVYNKHWKYMFSGESFSILKNLMLQYLPSGANILDLCCGTGKLANVLIEHGYQVTGVDGSAEMIRYARENTPEARFIVDDARLFYLPSVYHGVICAFDSLNHIMNPVEMISVFRNVYNALLGQGIFLFDLKTEDAYKVKWESSFSIVEDDNVSVFRSSGYSEEKTEKLDITIFRLLNGEWKRSDVELSQRAYSEDEILQALNESGFVDINCYDAQRGLEGYTKQPGRVFFVCYKP